MVARFPYGGTEASPCVDWLMAADRLLRADRRVSAVEHWRVNDTPITMGRNRAMRVARALDADILVMVDSDMAPDLYLGQDPNARPFLAVALDFLLGHAGPAVIAAPYLGPPPHENVYVFRWRNKQSDHPHADAELSQYTREEAAAMGGVHEAAALPTGLIAIDMRCHDLVRDAKLAAAKADPRVRPTPFFYYEWADDDAVEKSSTEDVTFSRDLSLAGVPQYCAWDSWAGHIKTKVVGRPMPYTPDAVAESLRLAVVNRHPRRGERLVDVRRKK